ncbi:PREDICTED: uncharacterized protein LOC108779571 [Cyphomyrmex costatus]|uniref:uncharacterized protein LOC108779571 n=1 Tax=Cyphomyrmex costatus TaxID=456900 RepID=UPI00085232F5|nr:PREDICTED: uncharacterized protein LOC108779571 [Cyphomyrmex costatus]
MMVHFSHDMWENNRADGKSKLKINAVPTIFGSEAKMIKSYHKNVRSALRNDDARPASRNDDARPASRNDDARPASQNDEMGYVHEDDLSVQNEKRNNDCENELQVARIKLRVRLRVTDIEIELKLELVDMELELESEKNSDIRSEL